MDVSAYVWRDTRRPLWTLALVVPALPFVALLLVAATGSSSGWWLTPVFILGVIPVIDLLIGDDRRNPPEDAVPALQASRYYRWITYLFLPAQFVALVMACAVWTRGPGPA
nr:hypothetical protein GCM10020092_072780 [Actinoplanes digitatis]